ncbi:nuclear pore complex protein Nup153 [Ixodes scapularis]|uniref:nuclear pore complex protein Nup153 n=1 Tax=Ixodes scapularis TaxID=6945 RepID=UPI001C38220F|nr:nuclear pore complex protein Nup153 [Ixodes scapularis]
MAGKLPSRLQGEKAHSSKPYERRKTLVQTVKELLLPSWLTSWNTPLVTEEEADNLWPREEASAPPDQSAKRPRTERPAAYSFAEPQDPREELAGPQSLLNGDSHSEKSEASGSTSGCSSLGGPERESAATPEPRARRHDWSHTRDCGVMANLPSSGIPDRLRGGNGHGCVGSAESASRQSPATPRWRVPQRTASGGQGPGFSLSAFGTPVTPGGRERQRLQSPFYPGRTTYGGAASYSRFRLATGGTPKAETSVQLRERRRGPEEEGLPDCMSNATRQILSTLERMASPLTEAKKVPLDRGSGPSLLSYMPPSQRRRAPYLRGSPVPGPPRSQHARPLASRTARNLDPAVSAARRAALVTPAPQDSQVREQREEITQASRPALETRVAPKDTPAPAPATNGSFPSCGGSDRAGGKVSRTRGIHSSRRPEQGFEDAPLPPDLPDIPLPIGSLPSFTFQLPAPIPVAKQTSGVQSTFANVRPTAADVRPAVADVRPTVTDIRQTVADIRPTATAKGEFALAQPLTLATASSVSSPAQEFSFSVPAQVTELQPVSQRTVPAEQGKADMRKKAEVPAGPAAPASQLVMQGSVMDVLGRKDAAKEIAPEPANVRSSGGKAAPKKSGDVADAAGTWTPASTSEALSGKSKPAAGSWSCSACKISNAESNVKCAACEQWPTITTAAAPASTSGPATTEAPSQGTPKGFGDLFRPSPATWECDSCMVRNEAKAQRCCACETPRVSPAPALWEKFKPAAGSWSCSECMISNAGTAVKCAACETPRPGAPPAAPTTATATAPASTLGPAATEAPSQGTPKGFGDLFRPSAATWECDTCMVRNEAKAQRCCACETPRVSSAPGPTGTFKFGIPTSATPATPAQTSAPATFKFGNLTATSAPTPFKFGTQETSTSAASPPVAQFKFGSAMLACKPQGPLGQDATFKQKVEERAGKPPAPGSAEPPKTEPAVVFGAPKTESSASPAVFSFVPSSFAPKRKNEAIAEAPEIKASMPSSAVFGGSAKTGGTARDSGLFGALAKASVGLPPASTLCPGGATAPKVADSVASAGAPTGGDSQKVGFSFDKLAKNSPTAATFSFGILSKPTESAAPQGSTTVAETKTTATSAAPASVGGFSFGAPPKTSEGGEPPKPVGGFLFGATSVAKSDGFAFNAATPKPASTFSFGNAGAVAASAAAPKPAPAFSFGNAGAQAAPGDAPGAAPSTPKFVFGQKTDTSPGTFTFGTASLATSPPAPASFGFPSAGTAAPATQPLAGQGSFGEAKPKASSGGFKFGTSQEGGSTFAVEAPQPAQSTPFSFGATPAPAPVGGGFSFGASQPAASQPAAPAFSFNAGVPTPAAPRLDFAQPSASPFGAAPPAAPAFAFGGPMAAPAAPQAASFQFGASAPNQGGVFRFGAPSQGAPESGTQPQPGGFNFSAAQPAALGAFGQQQQPGANPSQGGFGFNAAAPANLPGFAFPPGADNPFSATGTGGTTQARRIRKAIRRKPNQPR